MFRRTKLLITALFLVLLSVPMAYVALTWTTPDPLRFHIVAYHPPGSPEAWAEYGRLDLRVENTSNLPVYLFLPTFGRKNPSPMVTQLRCIPPDGRVYQLIPPRNTTALTCRVTFYKDYPPSRWDDIEVAYAWYSSARYRYSEFYQWLQAHAPKGLQYFLEYHYPQFEDDSAFLVPRHP